MCVCVFVCVFVTATNRGRPRATARPRCSRVIALTPAFAATTMMTAPGRYLVSPDTCVCVGGWKGVWRRVCVCLCVCL